MDLRQSRTLLFTVYIVEAADSTNRLILLKDDIDKMIWEQDSRLLWHRIDEGKTGNLLKAYETSIRTTSMM